MKGREQSNDSAFLAPRSVNFILGLLVGFSTVNSHAEVARQATVERLGLPLRGDALRGSCDCPSEDRPVYFGGACSHLDKGDASLCALTLKM